MFSLFSAKKALIDHIISAKHRLKLRCWCVAASGCCGLLCITFPSMTALRRLLHRRRVIAVLDGGLFAGL